MNQNGYVATKYIIHTGSFVTFLHGVEKVVFLKKNKQTIVNYNHPFLSYTVCTIHGHGG